MSEHSKTLVILTPAFAAHEDDSYLPAQEQFIKSLNQLYPLLEVVILSFHFPLTKEVSYTWNGNKVYAFSSGMKGKLNSLSLWRRVWKRLSVLRKSRDLIGVFSFFCSESAFVGHYFAKRHGLLHRIWVLGQDARKSNNQVRRIRPAPDELIVISDFLQKEFERNHGIRPSFVIPIGIRQEDNIKEEVRRDIDLIGAGSLSPIKRYDLFVEIVVAIRLRMPDIRAVICGNGREFGRLQEKIKEEGLEQCIELMGQQTPQRTLEIMQRSRILLHTSEYEGFGMVCTEALSVGAHVISFLKPMDMPIEHWHITETKEGMILKAFELLRDKDTSFTSVLPYKMEDTVIRILECFDYKGS